MKDSNWGVVIKHPTVLQFEKKNNMRLSWLRTATVYYHLINFVPIVPAILCDNTTCLNGGSCGIKGCVCPKNWWGDTCEQGELTVTVNI